MFDQKVRVLSESLARSMGRRKFISQMGATVFGGVATLAVGHGLAGFASADTRDGGSSTRDGKKSPPVTTPNCSPPGPYCNMDGISQPTGCHGGHCFQHLYQGNVLQCRVYYQFYQSGCWTTAGSGGYWTCCDCECSTVAGGPRLTTCGCAQLSSGPVPSPDGPGAASARA